MPFQRIAASTVLLIHLFASVSMGVVYLCQMSGQVGLSACCCQHERSGEGAPGHTDEIRALGCCEASQLEANRAPTLVEKRSGELPAVAVAVLPRAPDAPQRPDGAPAPQSIAPPSQGGPPIYLRTRALLL